jgi:hypothetical protein
MMIMMMVKKKKKWRHGQDTFQNFTVNAGSCPPFPTQHIFHQFFHHKYSEDKRSTIL